MNSRIRELRKSHKITQKDFAAVLGLSENFIWQIEKGDRAPSDRTIADICREFHVNETWLRTGEGEMHIELPEQERLAAFFGDVLASAPDERSAFISALAQLPKDAWPLLTELAREIVRNLPKDDEDEQEQKASPRIHVIKKAGRDGSVEELHLTDEDLDRFKDWKNGLDRPGDDI